MNSIDYYIKHSLFSDPGVHASYFAELPSDPEKLCKIIQGILLHFLDVPIEKRADFVTRMADMDLRFCEKILAKIIFLHDDSLLQSRQESKKLIGSCRDFSLLLCAILRHNNIPARLRFGFSTFQLPGFHHDQVLVEYWHAEQKGWCLADPRVNAIFRKRKKLHDNYCAHNVERHAFFTAGEAWLHCRQGSKNAEKFGTNAAREIRGWWYLRNKLIQDFAALNKMELLLWDCWGLMLSDSSDAFLNQVEQVELLDTIAKLTTQTAIDVAKINQVYLAQKELQVGNQVYCDSFAGQKGFQVIDSKGLVDLKRANKFLLTQ